MITIYIDGKAYECNEGKRVLQVAIENKIDIPTICFYAGDDTSQSCGLCFVKNEDSGEYVKACNTKAVDGLRIITTDDQIKEIRKNNMQKIVDIHAYKCGTCSKMGKCEVITTSAKLGARKDMTKPIPQKDITLIQTQNAMTIDRDKCILCGRCVEACYKNVGTNAVRYSHNYFLEDEIKTVGLVYDEEKCIYCGQCVIKCPVDAIKEVNEISKVKDAIAGPKKVVVAMAPATRVTLGDEFGIENGTNVEGKMYAALRALGFDVIFDLNYTADVTIMEEGTELLERITNKGPFPMVTSCCPGWVGMTMRHHPEFIPNLSTTKSPQQIFGALTKSYYAQKEGWKPEDIFTVTIVPCTAKKHEKDKTEMQVDGNRDVDAVLTTRDFAKMIKDAKIDFKQLEDGKADSIMADYTGAGVIFGQSGGVMEAALRFANKKLTGKDMENHVYEEIRGLEGVKHTKVVINNETYWIAVINGAVNFRKFLSSDIRKRRYIFIEVMACPGGCIAGGGQPFLNSHSSIEQINVKKTRIKSLQDMDACNDLKYPQDNPMIEKLYNEFLQEPGGHKSHKLLHTNHFKGFRQYHTSIYEDAYELNERAKNENK